MMKYSEYTNEFQSIKEMREHYGISRKELSDMTGIPYRTIENWETATKESRQVKDYLFNMISFVVKSEREGCL